MTRLRVLALASFLGLGVASSGCLSSGKRRERPVHSEHLPATWQDAAQLEEEGLKQLRTGNQLHSKRRRREHHDQAILLFREARELYVMELIETPGTPDQQTYLGKEIDRLSDLIEHVHRQRPIG